MADTDTATAEQPATIPVTAANLTFREQRDATEKGLTEIPNPAVEAAPDADVAANPELGKEIDALEAPKAEETPQDKAARTKRHKAAAQRGLVSRLANQRDKERDRAATAERERDDLRQRLQTPPVAQQGRPVQPAQAGTAPVYDGRHPNDPEPTEEAFASDADPFRAHERAHADWRQRNQLRQVEHSRRQASMAEDADQRRVTALRAFDTYATELRKTDPGFDAAIEHLDLSGPMQAVLFGSGELGPHLALYLAKDPALHQRILALPPAGQYVELGAVKATVTQARQRAAATSPPVTSAVPPPSTTASGSASVTSGDSTTAKSTSEHFRMRAAEDAERRGRGAR